MTKYLTLTALSRAAGISRGRLDRLIVRQIIEPTGLLDYGTDRLQPLFDDAARQIVLDRLALSENSTREIS